MNPVNPMRASFPPPTLSFYIYPEGDRKTQVQEFMSDLKVWLKTNRLTFAWLADNMGKSEGTVKNWFYSGLNLDDEKLEQIRLLCHAHLKGGQGVSYAAGSISNKLAYVWLKPFDWSHAAEPSFLHAVRKNDIGDTKPCGLAPENCNYSDWCLAAGVPEDTLAESRSEHYPAFAHWVTEEMMQATRKVLASAKKQGTLKMNAQTDGRAIPQNAPCESHFYVGESVEYYAADNDYPCFWVVKEEQITFFLPVIMPEWRSDYLRIAAAMSGYECTDQWIIAVLNEAAATQRENDLDDFLKGE